MHQVLLFFSSSSSLNSSFLSADYCLTTQKKTRRTTWNDSKVSHVQNLHQSDEANIFFFKFQIALLIFLVFWFIFSVVGIDIWIYLLTIFIPNLMCIIILWWRCDGICTVLPIMNSDLNRTQHHIHFEI